MRTFILQAIILAATCAGLRDRPGPAPTFDILVQQAAGQLVTAGCCVGQ